MRVRTPARRIIPLLLLSLVCLSADGRSWLGGLFSPKGTGLSSLSTAGESTYSLLRADLLLDMNGIIRGWNTSPGLRLRFANNYVLASAEFSTGTVFHFLAGPGLTVGYVSDIDNVFGWMGGVTADTALMFDFTRHIALCLSLSADFGMHYRSVDHHAVLSSYRSGMYHAYYPELTIYYRF